MMTASSRYSVHTEVCAEEARSVVIDRAGIDTAELTVPHDALQEYYVAAVPVGLLAPARH